LTINVFKVIIKILGFKKKGILKDPILTHDSEISPANIWGLSFEFTSHAWTSAYIRV
jgi:hypothetical protein